MARARNLSPGEVRNEAVRLALLAADERAECGDPEGEGCIRDLADAIRSIPLRTTKGR